jgi:hypothetical protein
MQGGYVGHGGPGLATVGDLHCTAGMYVQSLGLRVWLVTRGSFTPFVFTSSPNKSTCSCRKGGKVGVIM